MDLVYLNRFIGNGYIIYIKLLLSLFGGSKACFSKRALLAFSALRLALSLDFIR